jgi:hypothetical protein
MSWMRTYAKFIFAVCAVLAISAAPAYAYQESASSTDPGDTPPNSCPSCHGFESDTTSSTIAPGATGGTRKGPHGGYNTGTAKCQTCHSIHTAAADGIVLLPAATVAATCNTCHDGTGGGGVYGVIERRIPGATPGGHTIGGASNGSVTVPGGDPSGGNSSQQFSAADGGLTCTDCHSPHDTDTVDPFVGDRARSVTEETTRGVATSRLLRTQPTSADATVTAYGTDWCQSCHKGSFRGSMTHPVASKSTTWSADYMNVQRMAGYDTSSVAPAKGPLGGSNLGYVVPAGSGGLPICQQCHEDSREIANDLERPGVIDGDTEAFSAPVDGVANGNPRFQNFPHETVNSSMLVEPRDSLCLNCHDMASGSVH